MTLAKSLLIVIATTSLAHAQSAPAEVLFRQGRELIKQGKLEAGCDKLAASEKLESSVGTLLNLGDCREQLGQTATAWAAFRKAEDMAKRAGDDKKRQAEAKRRADKLDRELSRIVIQAGKSTPGLVIKRDGEVIEAVMLDLPLPVDPGPHVIIAEAPGHKPFKTEVSIGKGGKRYVVIPSLERERVVERAKPRTAPTAPPPVVVRETAPPPPATDVVVTTSPRYVTVNETWSTSRKVAIGLGVAGAAAIGTGIYFGTRAADTQAQSNRICPGAICDDPEGLRLNNNAQAYGLRANILFVAGGAAVGIATVMWFIGAPEERTVIAPAIGRDHVGASVTGRF